MIPFTAVQHGNDAGLYAFVVGPDNKVDAATHQG